MPTHKNRGLDILQYQRNLYQVSHLDMESGGDITMTQTLPTKRCDCKEFVLDVPDTDGQTFRFTDAMVIRHRIVYTEASAEAVAESVYEKHTCDWYYYGEEKGIQ